MTIMFARAMSGTIVGVEAHEVVVESFPGKGLPGMALIGLARGAVRESLVRVRSAILASNLELSRHRLVVNLLPAELPKEASALDLPLAIAILASAGSLPLSSLEGRRFYGELSLGGGLENVRGSVLLADLARRRGDLELVVPRDNAPEAAIIPGVRVIAVDCLAELAAYLCGTREIQPTPPPPRCSPESPPCLSDIAGQQWPKQALEIAAAGGHNLLLIGPPGSGKTMLARRIPGLLPDLAPDEMIETTRIHSAAGLLGNAGLLGTRPFRAPHHTASEVALCGGGSIPKPGEITLAHRGVLFLDELPEFSRRALESLREPLEEGSIHIARAACSLAFPADVLFVAAMNPCPCGMFRGDIPSEQRRKSPGPATCVCSFDQVHRYRSRISGPLLDRIDLHVLVDAVPYRHYAQRGNGETLAAVRERVLAARSRQQTRLGPARTNANMTQQETRQYVPLAEESLHCLENAIEEHGLSARAIGRILKVSRTIADLENEENVQMHHIKSAISFRVLDSNPAKNNIVAA